MLLVKGSLHLDNTMRIDCGTKEILLNKNLFYTLCKYKILNIWSSSTIKECKVYITVKTAIFSK